MYIAGDQKHTPKNICGDVFKHRKVQVCCLRGTMWIKNTTVLYRRCARYKQHMYTVCLHSDCLLKLQSMFGIVEYKCLLHCTYWNIDVINLCVCACHFDIICCSDVHCAYTCAQGSDMILFPSPSKRMLTASQDHRFIHQLTSS